MFFFGNFLVVDLSDVLFAKNVFGFVPCFSELRYDSNCFVKDVVGFQFEGVQQIFGLCISLCYVLVVSMPHGRSVVLSGLSTLRGSD